MPVNSDGCTTFTRLVMYYPQTTATSHSGYMDFYGEQSSWPFITEYMSLLSGDSPSINVSFINQKPLFAEFLQNHGFAVEDTGDGPVYNVNFAFITANNRSADAWSEEN